MQSVSQLVDALGRRAPFAKAAGWDAVGLQLGDAADPVRRVAVCHEVTEEVVARVELEPVDLLLTYHPLLFRATQRLVAGPTPSGRALRLARTGTAVVAVHTNFDVVPGGSADALAEALGLGDARGFAPLHGPEVCKVVTFLPRESVASVLDAVSAAGGGRIGNYSRCSYRGEGLGTFLPGESAEPAVGVGGVLSEEPEARLEFVVPRAAESSVVAALVAAHPYEEPAYDVYERRGDAGMAGRIGRPSRRTTLGELAELARAALRATHLRAAGQPDRVLERIAVVPGSGSGLLNSAADAGADAFVTGDLDHHQVRGALDRGLAVLDAGHVATERPGLDRLYAAVAALGVETVSLLELEADPWLART